MHKGQLARLPAAEGRRAERRMVNLAASLREPGATVADAEVLDLSVDGFRAASSLALEVGVPVWLKLPGLEPHKCFVVWVDGEKAGFKFVTPLHQVDLDQLVESARKPIPRGHFGPARFGAR
jgi:hypothetical protein